MSDSKFYSYFTFIALAVGCVYLCTDKKKEKKRRELSEKEVREILKKEGLYKFGDKYLDNYLLAFSEPGERHVSDDTYFRHYVAKNILKDEKKRREKISPLSDKALDRAVQEELSRLKKLPPIEGLEKTILRRLEMLQVEIELRKKEKGLG